MPFLATFKARSSSYSIAIAACAIHVIKNLEGTDCMISGYVMLIAPPKETTSASLHKKKLLSQ
jgi:hypothetical protein